MSRSVTVYDVAARAAVSIATVSRVLRSPDSVRPTTRERVREAVAELGYVPSGSARGLAERRTGVLGLYFPGFDAAEEAPDLDVFGDDPASAAPFTLAQDDGETHPTSLFLDEVLRGAELEAWKRGFVLMIGVGRDDPDRSTVRDMAGRVDGLVVLARSVPDDVLARLSRRIPVVVLSGPPRGDDYDHVTVSNSEAMAELTRHVLAQLSAGAQVAFLAGPDDSPDGGQRWEGFSRAIAEAGIEPDAVTVARGDFTRASGRAATRRLLEREGAARTPDAVVAANDQMALGAIDVLRDAGLRVPDDVLVTGFDGIEAAALSRPALTTIRQPMIDLGRAAVQVLARRLEHPDAEPAVVRLPLQILLRESSQRAS